MDLYLLVERVTAAQQQRQLQQLGGGYEEQLLLDSSTEQVEYPDTDGTDVARTRLLVITVALGIL